ncbi:very short patch repair endonuclease [Mycolicibacterium sp. P9-22]|uniref:very short patch repair endonuclease n=1 Tax=Mycolicibacterium sp. P9-22 TaxID=2024613 RepID=UPI0011EC37E7|nr:very short patch repair endonuclease [Mycolicibacterium sp. P9-22]KAA0115095.1 DNA mismatch endonuclease Vsr [Mycolicibacterium sp. P9-22]
MATRPTASSESVRSRMSRQRQRGTRAELRVRQALHARGIRFRVDVRLESDLRCRADIAWRALRLAIFIDGCFWHGCPIHATRPKANQEWWARKLDENVRRDRRTDAELTSRGWTVLRYWEHEEPETVAAVIYRTLSDLRPSGRGTVT